MLLHTPTPAPRTPAPTLQPQTSSVLLGESHAARRLRIQVQRIAPYLRTALIVGEAGTGKEQIARALHRAGPQAEGPFITCSAVVFAESLFEEGSSADAASVLNSARGGTLYLHGVDQLAYPLQGSLQRFLAQRESVRLAGSATRTTQRETTPEVKVIAGSCRDLRTLSSIGQFRTELYAKLSVLEVRAPGLRERVEDIAVIADSLLSRAAREGGTGRKVLSAAAMERLESTDWRENLRELEQALVHGAEHAAGSVIEEAHLPAPLAAPHPAGETPAEFEPNHGSEDRLDEDRLEAVVQRHVIQVLTRCRGNKLRAAEILGISRSTLYRMLDAETFTANTEQRGA